MMFPFHNHKFPLIMIHVHWFWIQNYVFTCIRHNYAEAVPEIFFAVIFSVNSFALQKFILNCFNFTVYIASMHRLLLPSLIFFTLRCYCACATTLCNKKIFFARLNTKFCEYFKSSFAKISIQVSVQCIFD